MPKTLNKKTSNKNGRNKKNQSKRRKQLEKVHQLVKSLNS